MRFVGLLLAAFAFVQQATAADLGILRGAVSELGRPSYFRWDGIYGGGQWGYSSATFNTANTSSDLIAFMLRNTTLEDEFRVSRWTTLPDSSTTGRTFGAFVGYNAQWDNTIVGVEVNYNNGKIVGSASDTLGRTVVTSDQYTNFVDLTASSSIEIKETATFRTRAGYVMGRFLPYATIGVAVARVDKITTATVDLVQQDFSGQGRPTLGLNETRTEAKKDIYTFGWAAGVGMDVALLQNIFLRGEFERLQFSTNGVAAGINSARLGLGLKF
jgi:outer membrane immunogenic protein